MHFESAISLLFVVSVIPFIFLSLTAGNMHRCSMAPNKELPVTYLGLHICHLQEVYTDKLDTVWSQRSSSYSTQPVEGTTLKYTYDVPDTIGSLLVVFRQ